MRSAFLCFSLCLIMAGCSINTIPLKATYSNGNFEQTTNKSKDAVWDQIIDFFAKNGLPISVIDRSSGLIVSNESQLTWSYENKKGVLINPKAYVAIAQRKYSNSTVPLKPIAIIGTWNVRIKSVGENQTLININLVNPKVLYYDSKIPTAFSVGYIQSTGNFEKFVFESIK